MRRPAPTASTRRAAQREQIEAVVAAIAPKPFNLLVGWPSDLTLRNCRARRARVSVGGALARFGMGRLHSHRPF